MQIIAPNTNPDVTPTPIHAQGSVWVSVAGIAGLLLDLIPIVPIPDAWKPYVPVVTMILGFFAHQTWGSHEYRPTLVAPAALDKAA